MDINLVTSSCHQVRKETGGFNDFVFGGEQGVAVCPVTSILLETKEELLIFVCLFSFFPCLYSMASSKLLTTGWETRSWLTF